MNNGNGTHSEVATGGVSTYSPALKLFIVLSRAWTAVERHAAAHAAAHGLTLAEFAILEALHHKGPLLLGELQRKVLTSSGGITYLVDRLTEKGLVERQDCPDDRRARFAALTQAGAALIDRIFPEHAVALERAMDGLDQETQESMIPLLRELGKYAAELKP